MTSTTTTTKTTSSGRFNVIFGNTLHVLNLINICVYGTLLYLYGYKKKSDDTIIFDEEWLKQGFCTPHDTRNPNATATFQTTHDLSGYVMVGIGLLGILLQRTMTKPPLTSVADRLAFWALIGALGHGAGHFLLSNAQRHEFYPEPDVRFLDDLLQNSTPLTAIGKAGPGYPLFWVPLTKTYMMNTSQGGIVAALAFVFWSCSLFVPSQFGFSYTQAVLFGGMSMDQILFVRYNEKQTLEYALWPLLTVLPNGIFAWIESMGCTTIPIMQEHGHLIYDVYMASSYIVFYLICFWYRTTTTTSGSTTGFKSGASKKKLL